MWVRAASTSGSPLASWKWVSEAAAVVRTICDGSDVSAARSGATTRRSSSDPSSPTHASRTFSLPPLSCAVRYARPASSPAAASDHARVTATTGSFSVFRSVWTTGTEAAARISPKPPAACVRMRVSGLFTAS